MKTIKNDNKVTFYLSSLGFTVMEIMVVLAIIVILAGLLSPALAKAKRLARRIECANHLKQIAAGLHVYALKNNGDFPAEPWGLSLYPDCLDDEGVFDCPVHIYEGTATAPDYWYVAGLDDNSASGTLIAGCYDYCHDGLENKITVDGRLITE